MLALGFLVGLSCFHEGLCEYPPLPCLDPRGEARRGRCCFLLFERQSRESRVVVALAHGCFRRVSADIGGASATRSEGVIPRTRHERPPRGVGDIGVVRVGAVNHDEVRVWTFSFPVA